MGWIFFVILAAFCLALLIGGSKKGDLYPYYTWAKIVAKIDDMPNCYLCSFEKDGEKITAIYCDETPHEIGNEIRVIYEEGDEASLPLVKKPS